MKCKAHRIYSNLQQGNTDTKHSVSRNILTSIGTQNKRVLIMIMIPNFVTLHNLVVLQLQHLENTVFLLSLLE